MFCNKTTTTLIVVMAYLTVQFHYQNVLYIESGGMGKQKIHELMMVDRIEALATIERISEY